MSVTAAEPDLLAMSAITKRFPGVVALQGVSLSLKPGEVLALMGENGAGKSTLMKILGGAQQPDEGEIRIQGKAVALESVRVAKRLGIALIHQELMLAPNLDIAANIFLGSEGGGTGPLLRPLPRGTMYARAKELLQRVGLTLPVSTPVSALTAGQMQMVEIAKALALNARIIIMDEPTSSLTSAESEQLFQIIHKLRADGIGIVYISHRMEEVMALADRVTVLRDGRHVGDLTRAEATHEKIVAMMVGRELSAHYFPEKRPRKPAEPVLVVEGLVVPGAPAPVSFSAERGEILGFAGLVGSGRTELMETIFGVTPALGGRMTLEGREFAPRVPRDAIDRGVYLAPEDRKRHGLVLPLSIAENTSLPDIGNYNRWGLLDRTKERRVAESEVKRLRTKTPGIGQLVVNLSGGNQQKVVLGKWLAMSPRVLILDEPTRGIDVGTKAEIYRHMAALADEGITIMMVSSDMEEIMGMSDRVAVMHERRIKGVLPRERLSQERIATLMTGHADREAFS
ncbi:sugar ABC transporter ATP-binding protein [Sorangium sp. So ce1099]|uniref:sugar ABC transporter ATP-binding protein n=1 Tax=Sorangium sp. So ce1099 TaxID=3133331 RepID=UPI003F632B12